MNAGKEPPIANLVLEDGSRLQGFAFGAEADAVFELVFNTSMTGYQEILTDPSYRGQGVLFTVAHIGNVGINIEDFESDIPQASAVVVRSISPTVSNWRASLSLPDYLASQGVPGISGVDTRWLTRKLRDAGTQKAALSTCGTPPDKLLEMARGWPGLDGRDMVKEVTCAEAYPWLGDAGSQWVPASRFTSACRIAAYDFGIKRNILRHLASFGAQVMVLPAGTPAREVLALQPDGIFLSNGPGDPAGLPYAVEAVAELIDSGLPVLGICLGHQLIGRALGGETQKLKFGHHGGNHPVLHMASGKALITAQNHNYCVMTESLDPSEVEITYKSLNDDSLEGIRLKHRPVFSVQFHPEAAPGPHDAHWTEPTHGASFPADIFGEFFALVRAYKEHLGESANA